MLGHATEEKLISAVKQVASFTAQLLLACRVRGDMKSPTMKHLLVAGNAVRRATDHLVQVFVGKRHENSPDSSRASPGAAMVNVVVNKKLVGGIAQEIKANVRRSHSLNSFCYNIIFESNSTLNVVKRIFVKNFEV